MNKACRKRDMDKSDPPPSPNQIFYPPLIRVKILVLYKVVEKLMQHVPYGGGPSSYPADGGARISYASGGSTAYSALGKRESSNEDNPLRPCTPPLR